MADTTTSVDAGLMKVRFNPPVGILMLVLGIVCTVLGAWQSMLGEFTHAVWMGPFAVMFGVLFLTRPYFWVHSMSVIVPAVIGPMKRNFPFQSLEVEGNKLITLRDDGTRKKVPVARWFAHSADWQAVTNSLRR